MGFCPGSRCAVARSEWNPTLNLRSLWRFKAALTLARLLCPPEQAPRVPSAADAGLVPGSAAEGQRSVHGRPPCAALAWGFGGRVALSRPRPQARPNP